MEGSHLDPSKCETYYIGHSIRWVPLCPREQLNLQCYYVYIGQVVVEYTL